MAHRIEDAKLSDIIYVLGNLRTADKKEIWASHKKVGLELVPAIYVVGAKIAIVDETPAILFGCSTYEGIGVPWMLATNDILKVARRFVRESRNVVDEWVQEHKCLSNYVHADNEVSINWLKWLGFEFKESALVNNEKFIRFERRLVDV